MQILNANFECNFNADKCKLNANFECNANQLATQSDHWTTFSPPGRWCFMYFVNYQVQRAEKPIGYYPTHFQLSALHLQFLRCFKLKVQSPIQRQDLPSTDLPHVQFEFPFSLNGPSAVKPSNEIWAIWMLNTNKSTLAYPPLQSITSKCTDLHLFSNYYNFSWKIKSGTFQLNICKVLGPKIYMCTYQIY